MPCIINKIVNATEVGFPFSLSPAHNRLNLNTDSKTNTYVNATDR